MSRRRTRIWILTATLLCCVGICGCGRESADGHTVESGQESVTQSGGVFVANPWKDITEEEAQKTAGGAFRLPSGAKNVQYRYLEEEQMTEAMFDWENCTATVRKKPESGLEDISGMYYDWVVQNDVMVGSFRGLEKMAYPEQQNVKLCLWYQPEDQVLYSLSLVAPDLSTVDIRAMAEEMCGEQDKETIGE